ncbi:MAG: hypothetical protein H6658_02150 [Ardenticatenaceae bacterium]|nr:hypothetical protein [Ardenticatenaceae bacterium]
MARRTNEIKEITKAEIRTDPHGGGYVLHVAFDGREADIWYEQKLLQWGFVFLGSEFSDFEIVLPADPDNGRLQPQQFQSFTNDVRILKLTKQYLQSMEDGSWKLGPVKM